MPHIPYSCPDFDEAIDAIERARKINTELRSDLEDAESRAGDTEELEEEKKELEERCEALEEELEEDRALLAQKDAEIESLREQLAAANDLIQPSLELAQ